MNDKFFANIYSFIVLSHLAFSKDKKPTFYYSTFFTKEAPNVSFDEIHLRINDIYFKDLMIFSIGTKQEEDFKEFKQIKGYGSSTLTIYYVKPTVFFSINFLKELATYLKNSPGTNIALIYEGWSLNTIKLAFKMNGIQISGGNNTLKHILSPQQFLLSKIITIFYGCNMDLVSKSFLEISKNKVYSRAIHDFTSEKDRLLLKQLQNNNKVSEDSTNDKNLVDDKVEVSNNIKNIKNVEFNYTQKRDFHSSLRLKSYNYINKRYYTNDVLKNFPFSTNKSNLLYMKKGVRVYSTNLLSISKRESNLIDRDSISILLSRLEVLCENNKYVCNNYTQEAIENFCLDQFNFLGKEQNSLVLEGVKMNPLTKELNRYLMDKLPVLKQYIGNIVSYLELENDNLLKSKTITKKEGISKTSSKSLDESREETIIKNNLLIDIINGLHKDVLAGSCIFIFYACLSFWESSGENKSESLTVVPMSIKVGSNLINKYLYILYLKQCKNLVKNKHISFSTWKNDYLSLSHNYFLEDDRFISTFGCKLIEILEASNLVKQVLVRESYNKSHWTLSVYDDHILEKYGNKKKVHVLPFKLPMIVEPKDHTNKSLGGYLLNDVKTTDSLVIEKAGYKYTSEFETSCIIYELVNGVSKVPYKVNGELLDFLLNNKQLNILIDINKPHKYQYINRNKYQDKVYKSYVSKLLLQENILDIASIYRNFSKMYFPVRIDQRGRLYCSPAYFHYQSTELSKALLLFAKPGVINRNDTKAIDYLKAYGANSFGGSLDKKSLNVKIKWVNDNINDIIDVENGKLLSKAKNKFLFLSFCIEYRRLHNCFSNQEVQYFNTYLPIQLDATCNGFQHMSLLSNEESLFKELNLVADGDTPKDFYNFILDKLMTIIDNEIYKNKFEKEDIKDSYVRLQKFIWERSDIKKAIMTIPYNATVRSMKNNLVENLEQIYNVASSNINEDLKNDKKLIWYGTISNKDNIISNKDLVILINIIHKIIMNDYERIKKLCMYLKNVASLFNKLDLPIIWTLPSGLKILQSYMKTESVKITPFNYRKISLNIRVTDSTKFDKSKQSTAFMPNLIHSLDSASLALLYIKFNKISDDKLFFSIHDCFAVTASNVETLKILLASVYTGLYSETVYLKEFDNHLIETINKCSDCKIDLKTRTVDFGSRKKPYIIHDIDWVLGDKHIMQKDINKINKQFIII